MLRSLRFFILGLVSYGVMSCAKTGEDPADGLEGTRWQVTLTDANPASNPGQGSNILYHPWLECDQDDTYTFRDGRIVIDGGAVSCEGGANLIASLHNQPFTYDATEQRLILGNGDTAVGLEVYELNASRLKLGALVPGATGNVHLIFLFKKK